MQSPASSKFLTLHVHADAWVEFGERTTLSHTPWRMAASVENREVFWLVVSGSRAAHVGLPWILRV